MEKYKEKKSGVKEKEKKKEKKEEKQDFEYQELEENFGVMDDEIED